MFMRKAASSPNSAKRINPVGPFLVIVSLLLTQAVPNARANVYATNVRLNGGLTNVSVNPGGMVQIGYILNEPANVGVTIDIKSADSSIRTLVLSNTSANCRGTN